MASLKSKQPLEVITVKGSSVAIYPTPTRKSGKEYPGHTLAYTAAGRRVRKFVTSLETAREAAKAIAEQLSQGTGHVHALTPSQAAEFSSAERALRSVPGVSLTEAVSIFARAAALSGGASEILHAVKFYADHLKKQQLKQISVADLVAEFLSAKERDGLSDRYIGECKLILSKFKDSFRCSVAGIQTADLQGYIDRLKLGPRSKKNHRGTIVALFAHARRRGYLPRDTSTEADHLDSPKEKAGKIGIYSPDQLGKVLRHAKSLNKLVVAIGAYAGLRSAEMQRLEWEDIGDKYITVGADKSKTSDRRLVPILPALAAILAGYSPGSGKIFPHTNPTHFSRFIMATFEAAGLSPVRNGLRHSFCTYRLADTQSAAQVALEAGNSPKMLFKHYRELATKEEAIRWFVPVAS